MRKIICDHCKKEFKYDAEYSKNVCYVFIAIPEYDENSESFKSNTRLRVGGDLCRTCLNELYNELKCFFNTQEETE